MEEKQGFARDPKRAKRLGAKGGRAKVPKGFAVSPELARLANAKSVEARRKKREAKLKEL